MLGDLVFLAIVTVIFIIGVYATVEFFISRAYEKEEDTKEDVRETLSKKFNEVPFYTWHVTKTYGIVEEVTYVGDFDKKYKNSKYFSNGFTFGDTITPNSNDEDVLFFGSKEECEHYVYLVRRNLLKRKEEK